MLTLPKLLVDILASLSASRQEVEAAFPEGYYYHANGDFVYGIRFWILMNEFEDEELVHASVSSGSRRCRRLRVDLACPQRLLRHW